MTMLALYAEVDPMNPDPAQMIPTLQPPELLTSDEVANLFHVDTATVRRWAKTGRLPVYLLTPGGRPRYLRADVMKLRGWA
jgi:excisionase family DNA binding protein